MMWGYLQSCCGSAIDTIYRYYTDNPVTINEKTEALQIDERSEEFKIESISEQISIKSVPLKINIDGTAEELKIEC